MSDNIANITLTQNTWIDLYAATGTPVGTAIMVENVGVCDIFLAVKATEPDLANDSYNVLSRESGVRLKNTVGDSGAWAFCRSSGGKIAVGIVDQQGFYNPLETTRFVDATGAELILEDNGAVPVNVQDQHTEIIDLLLSYGESGLTLDADTDLDDTQVLCTLDPGFDPTVDSGPPLNATLGSRIVCLKQGTAFYQGGILAAVNQGGDQWLLTLDTPLDYAFSSGAVCSVRTTNMRVVASRANPIVFSVSPAGLDPETRWDVVRCIMIFQGLAGGGPTASVDMAGFGTEAAITNGIVWRKVNGVRKNLFNAKTNAELKSRAYDVEINPADRDLVFTVSVRRTFGGQEKNGVVIRLENNIDPDAADRYDIIIQDDLSSHIKINTVIQGHVVTGAS